MPEDSYICILAFLFLFFGWDLGKHCDIHGDIRVNKHMPEDSYICILAFLFLFFGWDLRELKMTFQCKIIRQL